MRKLIGVLFIVTLAPACYKAYEEKPEPVVTRGDDHEGGRVGDVDSNGIDDVTQSVIVAAGPKGSGMCMLLHSQAQAYDPSCLSMGTFGYGSGAYGVQEEGWEIPFLAIVPVMLDGNNWCGAYFRPGTYRITTAHHEAQLYDGWGWSDHSLGASADAGDFRWLTTRSEGSEDCYHEVTNITFGCDIYGKPYEVDGASLGERDPTCF
ncbi:MAG: hypothetical protein WAZ14_02550 [Patescibacteria group bacterium]